MTKKKNIYQSIKKDIRKGIRRLFWFFYTNIKYKFLTINFNDKKNLKEFKISILLPTRERSIKFKRMLDSLIRTCKNIYRIELLILLDEDDREFNKYEEIIKDAKYKNLKSKIYIINLPSHAKRNNYLATKSTGEILFPFNDDVIFMSQNWDIEIDLEFSKIKNRPYSLWINSGQKYLYLHSDFPVVNRIWYEKLGYVGSEFFNFWYLDTWICDLGLRSKKFLISKKIKLYQYSANTINEEVDSTHLKNIKNDIPKKDEIIWLETENERKKDAKLLI